MPTTKYMFWNNINADTFHFIAEVWKVWKTQCLSLTFIVTWRRQESWENLPFVNATLALKHPGISKMEKIKNILVLNIEYPIRTFVHMSERTECKGFLIAMELNIQVSKSQNGGCFKEVSTPFCWICFSPRERSPV